METRICPICGGKVMHIEKHLRAEKQLIEIIKTEHPEWVQEKGLCPKCLEHYRQELAKHSNDLVPTSRSDILVFNLRKTCF